MRSILGVRLSLTISPQSATVSTIRILPPRLASNILFDSATRTCSRNWRSTTVASLYIPIYRRSVQYTYSYAGLYSVYLATSTLSIFLSFFSSSRSFTFLSTRRDAAANRGPVKSCRIKNVGVNFHYRTVPTR